MIPVSHLTELLFTHHVSLYRDFPVGQRSFQRDSQFGTPGVIKLSEGLSQLGSLRDENGRDTLLFRGCQGSLLFGGFKHFFHPYLGK